MIKTPKPRVPAKLVKAMLAPPPPAWAPQEVRLAADARLSAMVLEAADSMRTAFTTANGKATAHTLQPEYAVRVAQETEALLAADGVPVALRAGVTVMARSAGPSAKAYKYAAQGTAFILRRNTAGDYDLLSVTRSEVWPGEAKFRGITISPAAGQAVQRHALQPYIVEEPGNA